MGKWLREPLIHFLLLGGLIFLAYDWLAGRGSAPDEIFISRGQQENLLSTFSKTWQRPPTPEEFQGLLKDYLRQEIAYRESRKMGLDEDDIVVRRRLRQKLEMLAEDVASLTAPDDAQLQEYLDRNIRDFMVEPRMTFRHIYFSRDRRGEAVERDAAEMLQRIAGNGLGGDFNEAGDPLPLPPRVENLREGEIARLFGEIFIDGLRGVETERWSGPVESGFGLHLVFIEERIEGRAPDLDEVREDVQREWLSRRRREAVDGLYERLAENYTVEIESLMDGEQAGSP